LQIQINELQPGPITSTVTGNLGGSGTPAYPGGFTGDRRVIEDSKGRQLAWASCAPRRCLKCKDSASPAIQNTSQWG